MENRASEHPAAFDFDFTDNFATARREQARAVHDALDALVKRFSRIVSGSAER